MNATNRALGAFVNNNAPDLLQQPLIVNAVQAVDPAFFTVHVKGYLPFLKVKMKEFRSVLYHEY